MRSRIVDGLLFVGALAISIAFVWWIAQPDTQPRAAISSVVVPRAEDWCGARSAPNDYEHALTTDQVVRLGVTRKIACSHPRAAYELVEIGYHNGATDRDERGYVPSDAIARSRSATARTLWLIVASMLLGVALRAYATWTRDRRAAARGYDGRLAVQGAASRREQLIFGGLLGVTAVSVEGAVIGMFPTAPSALLGTMEAISFVLVLYALAWTVCRAARIEPQPPLSGVGALAAAQVTGPHQGT